MTASLRSKITFAGFAVAAVLGTGLGTALGELGRGWFEVGDEPPQAHATRRTRARMVAVRFTVAGA
jgi:hypothetical protein